MNSFNVNHYVKVKLTDLGKEIYKHHDDEFLKEFPNLKPIPLDIDEQGYCKFQLWHFMNIFGEHFGNGFPLVIESNTILFEDKDLNEVTQ